MGFYGFDNECDFNEYRLPKESESDDTPSPKKAETTNAQSRYSQVYQQYKEEKGHVENGNIPQEANTEDPNTKPEGWWHRFYTQLMDDGPNAKHEWYVWLTQIILLFLMCTTFAQVMRSCCYDEPFFPSLFRRLMFKE